MSWLSAALKRNHLDVLNQIAKPVQAVVNPMIDKLPVIGSIKSGVEAVGNMIPQVGGDAAKAIGGAVVNKALPQAGALGGLMNNNGAMTALAAAQLANAANLGKQSTEYAKNAMNTQNDLWNQRAGLRSSGIAGMTAPPPPTNVNLPTLSALPQGPSIGGNPFAKRTV
jgi:hypothetical protein